MKTSGRFKKAYLIFLAVCIALSAVFLVYVGFVVRDFDRSQPENIVREKVEWLSSKAADGTLASLLDFEKFCSNPYEENDVGYYTAAYLEKLKGAALTYEYAASQSGELSKTYNILADDKPAGTLTLSGSNSRSRLFFFNMADWAEESFIPVLADTVYNLTLYKPEGISVLINGIQPLDKDLDGDIENNGENSGNTPVYSIKGLLKEPVIEYKRANGEALRLIGENNVIKPALYDYNIELPSDLKLSVNEKTITGSSGSEGTTSYTVLEMEKPEVVISDVLGNRHNYDPNADKEPFYNYEVVIPENFTLSIEGKDADGLCSPTLSPHPDAAVLLELASVNLPKQKTYTLSLFSQEITALITDESGASKELAITDGHTEISTISGGEIPEDIAAQINVLQYARNWSLFMTNDLPGDQNGLYTAQAMFIRDSDYYHYAYQWATGVDITFTSAHVTSGIVNERVSSFTRYNDICFSCEVYLEKNMSLYKDERYVGERTDIFNSIMYFVFIDDTPNNGINDPHWAIAAMHDVV